MKNPDFTALLPLIIVAATGILVMLAIAVRRDHRVSALFAAAGLLAAAGSAAGMAGSTYGPVTPLIAMDPYGLYFMALLFAASAAVAGLSYSYLEMRSGHREEFYLLLLMAALGSGVLAASVHFASLFLGIEILSVSLYALAAYHRHRERSIEAGIKYLILAAVSSAFILFGMALLYAETGSMSFSALGSIASSRSQGAAFLTGIVLILVGLGFKLAVVPFHLWTPDVYEGAPAPVTAFIASVSKGAVFALVLRFFDSVNTPSVPAFSLILTIVAAASMFAGNLLALLQQNIKRVLAYSSIAHLGYLLVMVVATGQARISAAAFYLVAYLVTILGAFGVVALLSDSGRDADRIEDYVGLAWRRPWLGGVFTAMLLSLAGMPLTAGFIAKFYLIAAGARSALWFLVIVLALNSAISIFYYLRIAAAVFSDAETVGIDGSRPSRSGNSVLACLAVLLVWLGIYPGPMLTVIRQMLERMVH